MYAKKFKEQIFKDGLETTICEYILIDDVSEDDFELLHETIAYGGDDYEGAYYKGLVYNWDDFFSLDVNKVLDSISEYLEDEEEDSLDVDRLKDLKLRLEKYKDYDIMFDLPDNFKKELNKND
jgi:hypothetical protein